MNLTANSKFYADKKEREVERESKTPQGWLGEIKQKRRKERGPTGRERLVYPSIYRSRIEWIDWPVSIVGKAGAARKREQVASSMNEDGLL